MAFWSNLPFPSAIVRRRRARAHQLAVGVMLLNDRYRKDLVLFVRAVRLYLFWGRT